jgi:hypothetical protein
MDYKTLENMLAQLHGIEPEGLKAFRSRLRVLRDIGVPAVVRPGKGSRVDYSFEDLWEAHIGLLLEEFGLPPSRVAIVSKDARARWFEEMREEETSSGGDAWALLMPSNFQRDARLQDTVLITKIESLKGHLARINGMQELDEAAFVYGLLNISKATRECETAMTEHAT